MKSVIQSICWFLSPLVLLGWIYALTKAAMYLFGLPSDPAGFFASHVLIMIGGQFGFLIYVRFGSLINTTEGEDEK
jgi:hypothetical protein